MRHVYRAVDTDPNRLVHHGIKGQKWGVRRFQNKDGSLTSAGKQQRAQKSESSLQYMKKYEKAYLMNEKNIRASEKHTQMQNATQKLLKTAQDYDESQQNNLSSAENKYWTLKKDDPDYKKAVEYIQKYYEHSDKLWEDYWDLEHTRREYVSMEVNKLMKKQGWDSEKYEKSYAEGNNRDHSKFY